MGFLPKDIHKKEACPFLGQNEKHVSDQKHAMDFPAPIRGPISSPSHCGELGAAPLDTWRHKCGGWRPVFPATCPRATFRRFAALWKVTLRRNFKGHLGDQKCWNLDAPLKKVQPCLIRTVYLKSNPWILIYFDPRSFVCIYIYTYIYIYINGRMVQSFVLSEERP